MMIPSSGLIVGCPSSRGYPPAPQPGRGRCSAIAPPVPPGTGGAIITEMEIKPATSDLWPQLQALFAHGGGPDARFCWCVYWRVRSMEFSRAAPAANRERLRHLVETGPPPGLVALEADRAVGWVGLGPRPTFPRLERSRVIPRTDGPVPWSIVCFIVARDARGHGIARDLLGAAVEHARAAGATAVEGYPIDTSAVVDGRVADTGAYVGTRSMFERAGFRLIASTTAVSGGAPRIVMRLELG